jgi:radical SAM superfamily enzyme YgiQ (UPF0313 family)
MPFPFYLAYATALLEKEGFECRIVDGVALRISEEDYISRATIFQPDLIIQEVSTPSLETDLRQTALLHKHCPNALIAICGLHVVEDEIDFLGQHPEVNFLLAGEYDYTVLELARAMDQNLALQGILGLSYRDLTTAKTVHNHRRAPIRDLDALPWPSREQLPMLAYHDLPGGIPAPSLQVWASRGCPFGCSFCVWPQIMYGENRYNTRNPVDVVDEIEYCVKQWGFRSFYFDDDTFNIGKKRLITLGQEISSRNLALPWAAMCRADTFDRETLVELKKSGLCAVKYGVESASQELVDHANKKLDLKKVEEMVRITRELGIRIHLTFSFGLPGETHETAKKTIQWSQKLNPDSIQYSIMTPFPGSRFYRELEASGHLVSKDWSKFDGNSLSVVRTEALTPQDLQDYIRKAYHSWEWHRLRRVLLNPLYFKKALRHPLKGLRDFRYGLKAAARS